MDRPAVRLFVAALFAMAPFASALAQDAPDVDPPLTFDGPPPPVPPEVISRDASGRTTVRAVRLTTPLRLDGRLDEELYQTVPSMSGFIQGEPQAGAPATQQTEVWMFFDDEDVYFGLRCWEAHMDRVVANDMRRDGSSVPQNDYVSLMIDTFYDRRNGIGFAITPIGGVADGQVLNERNYLGDWNTIFDLAVGRFDGGWTVELAIPFKSLRYRPGREQLWGLHVQRQNRWKNETSYLVEMPNANALGPRAVFQMSYAATVVGIEAPPAAMNLEIKPYVIGDLTTDEIAVPAISDEAGGDIGLDVKYGVTQSLTADFTVNTDFAQVEADEQQINLTRFSLFFPEKREFFLENQGLFGFGGNDAAGRAAGDVPVLFYSRQIGLNRGRPVPIRGGGRLTGRVGRYSLGLLNIQTSDEPVSSAEATNFSVIRLKRDIWRRSAIGAIFTGRSIAQSGVGSSQTYGVDGGFTFFGNLNLNAYWARTGTDGRSGANTSYRTHLDYTGDRYGVQLEHLLVGRTFNPEVGFLRRSDMRKSFAAFRFSPRPRVATIVRKYSWTGSMFYIENGAGRLETRTLSGEFGVELQSADRLTVGYDSTYEFLPRPFRIATGVTLPVGGYDFNTVQAGLTFGPQRRLYGNLRAEYGTFYSGHRTAVSISRGRVRITPQFAIEPSFSINWVDLAEGSFTTQLVGSRMTYTMTPKMFTSALLQYNSSNNSMAANIRLRWEYQPGSELFVVYNEQRDTLAPRFPELKNRAVVIKINRLFRF